MRNEKIEVIKQKYLPGTRIKLSVMVDDPQPISSGSYGTVDFVDDAGQIHMIWDNGRTLALIPGIDSFEIVKSRSYER